MHYIISTVVIGVSVRVDGGPNTSSLDQTYGSRSPPFTGIHVSCHLKHNVQYIIYTHHNHNKKITYNGVK